MEENRNRENAENTEELRNVEIAQAAESMTLEYLMAEAERRTGLNDWGDESFLQPLRRFLESLKNDHNPDENEMIFFHRVYAPDYIQMLCNRLHIENDIKCHPEILDVKIEKPLIILGLPRTGTTLLHNLLSKNPAFRTLLYWELRNPTPPPDIKTRHCDPRIEIARQLVDALNSNAPDLKKAHFIDPTGPEECIVFLRHTFMYEFMGYWRVKSYQEWVMQQDFTPVYKYYRKVLQLLSWKCPGKHVLLKNPQHLISIEGIINAFPDACILWTHRDIREVVPSFCSLLSNYFGSKTSPVLKAMVAQAGAVVNHAVNVREQSHPGHFFDVNYQDMVEDPITVIREIYKHFDYEYQPQIEEDIKKWLNDNPKNKHGSHRYSLEEFGFQEKELKSIFEPYLKYFNFEF